VSYVLNTVRELGLAPNAQPMRRGAYYIVMRLICAALSCGSWPMRNSATFFR